MVYKLISEWRGKEGAHEITMYKYNLNHDEMVRYHCQGTELLKQTYVAGGKTYEECYDLRDGEQKWWNYNTMKVEN